MDFTQYEQLLTSLSIPPSARILDIMGHDSPSSADRVIRTDEVGKATFIDDETYHVIGCRFALSKLSNPFVMLNNLIPRLQAGGYFILQDYVVSDDERVADYVNGFIHLFNNKHVRSFARYAWDGLLLDVGLNIQTCHQRAIMMTIQDWIEIYEPDEISLQQAYVMLTQAPTAVIDAMQLQYQGTPYTKFELQEIVCVAQKEA